MMIERPHWKYQIAETIARLRIAPRLLVASDFDGTLSPFVDHPAQAALHASAPQALGDLSKLFPRVRLAFLSGRGLLDLRPRIGLASENVVFAGNHGLELQGAGIDWSHPTCLAARQHLTRLAVCLSHAVDPFEGVELEDKGASLTLHYRRMVEEDLPALHDVLSGLVLPTQLRMHEGHRIFEFRPRVEWNKGYAIRRIMRHLDVPDAAVVYLGDDSTDEDVFSELSRTAVTLHVGPASAPSRALFNADDPADAVEFLGVLASAI